MATQDELLQQWAAQNGADYNLLASAQNGNTQTTTTSNPTQSEMDAMKDLYPNLQYPSDYNNTTSTTQNPTTTTANNDPWSWNNTPTTTTPTTTTTAGTSVEDYINYYKNLGQTTPDKDYDTWVAWMQSNSSTPTTTNPTNPTNPSNPSTPTTTPTTQGTSVEDYIN